MINNKKGAKNPIKNFNIVSWIKYLKIIKIEDITYFSFPQKSHKILEYNKIRDKYISKLMMPFFQPELGWSV